MNKRYCPACDNPETFERKICSKCGFNFEERE